MNARTALVPRLINPNIPTQRKTKKPIIPIVEINERANDIF